MTYEQAIEELNKIAKQLENPEIKIDEAISLFEQSIKLTKFCMDKLKETEGKIVVLKKEQDKMLEVPIE
ncbi:MAG: exodeoxyribonuclease VII small subunit [Clostridia bacterium]|nr:exodeoxyribonuclease VII small subunit [Clostridia bacterium]